MLSHSQLLMLTEHNWITDLIPLTAWIMSTLFSVCVVLRTYYYIYERFILEHF